MVFMEIQSLRGNVPSKSPSPLGDILPFVLK